MKRRYKIIISIITCLVTLVITGVATYSRYLKDSLYNYYLESHGFYFTSEELGDNKINSNMLWDGSRVYFRINNYLNRNLITDYDINYTVSCQVVDNPNIICSLNGENKTTVSLVLNQDEHCTDELTSNNVSSYDEDACESAEYTWGNHQVTDELYFEVSSNNGTPIDDVEVAITATSTAPYQKTLTGTFKLHHITVNNQTISYTINNQDLYHELVLTNSTDQTKCVMVSFDSSLRILANDQSLTNLVLDNNGYINSFKVNVSSLNNKKVKLYSKTANLTNNFTDIVVTESNGC